MSGCWLRLCGAECSQQAERLRHVQVDPHSKVEKLLAIAAMAPYFIMCALTTLIVRCRELLVCSWLVGHLLNEVLNFVLKRAFKEKRPPGAPAVG